MLQWSGVIQHPVSCGPLYRRTVNMATHAQTHQLADQGSITFFQFSIQSLWKKTSVSQYEQEK